MKITEQRQYFVNDNEKENKMREAITIEDRRNPQPLPIKNLRVTTLLEDILMFRAQIKDFSEKARTTYITSDERRQLRLLENDAMHLNNEISERN